MIKSNKSAKIYALAASLAIVGAAGVVQAYGTAFVGGNGGSPNSYQLYSGHVRGIYGRSGSGIDEFGLYTDSLSITPAFGGSGGSPFSTICPDNYKVVGFEGRAGSRVDAVAPICVHPDDINLFNTPRRFAPPQPIKGGPGGNYFNIQCGVGNATSGFFGRFGSRVDALASACRL